MHKFIINDGRRLANNSMKLVVRSLQLNTVHVWVKCVCLSASASAFYPLQHPNVHRSARLHFTPGLSIVDINSYCVLIISNFYAKPWAVLRAAVLN